MISRSYYDLILSLKENKDQDPEKNKIENEL